MHKNVTVFPLMLLPFMKTVFTEVLDIRPCAINSDFHSENVFFQKFDSAQYKLERIRRKGEILVTATCISVLRVSDVRRQSDKSSWGDTYHLSIYQKKKKVPVKWKVRKHSNKSSCEDIISINIYQWPVEWKVRR